jgi:hypothetical protein
VHRRRGRGRSALAPVNRRAAAATRDAVWALIHDRPTTALVSAFYFRETKLSWSNVLPSLAPALILVSRD